MSSTLFSLCIWHFLCDIILGNFIIVLPPHIEACFVVDRLLFFGIC